MMCFAVNHKNHDTVTVEQALSKILPKVNQDLKGIGVKLEDITKAIEETDRQKSKAEETFDQCVEMVDQKFEERIEEMHHAQNQLKEKLKNDMIYWVTGKGPRA